MNKLILIASFMFMGALICGCATKGGIHPATEWQTTRVMHEQIDAVKAQGKVPQLLTVTYKSVQTGLGEKLGAPINAFAPVPAALYLKVVNGLDVAMVAQSGRHARDEFFDLLVGNEAEGVSPMTKEQILAKWTEDDAAALMDIAPEKRQYFKGKYETVREYKLYLENSDPDALIPMIQEIATRAESILANEYPALLATIHSKGAALIQEGMNDPLGKGLAVKDAVANSETDLEVLGRQLKDVGIGAAYWLSIAKQDSAAKKDLEAFDKILN